MSDDFYFNPEEEEGSHFDPVPADWYEAEIIEVEITPPSTGDGNMLVPTWKITKGDYEGRQLRQWLCFQHSKLQTQKIARRTLKDLCVALDITEHFTDPQILKFKPARIRVVIKVDNTGQRDDSNQITRVRPLSDSDGEAQEARRSAAAPKPAPKEVPRPPKPAGNGPGDVPWKKGQGHGA